MLTDSRTTRSGIDVAAVLIAYVVLVFGLPTRLIVGPLGAQGTPAVILGILGLFWWICGRVAPSLGLAEGRQPIRIGVFLFSIAVLLSYGLGHRYPLDVAELTSADRGLLLLASCAGIALLASDGITSRERLDAVLRALVWMATFCATLGIIAFVTHVDLASDIRVPGLVPNTTLSADGGRSGFVRVAGTTGHPIEFGVVLSMVLPIALHYTFADRHRKLSRRWLPVLLLVFAIPMSVSRSGVLGVAIGCLVVFVSWPRRRKLRTLCLVAVYAVVMRVLIPGLLGTIKSGFLNASSDDSIKGRTEDYKVVGQFISAHPWFGRGFFTFLPSKFFILDNAYLGLLIEIGVVGLVLFLALLVTGFGCAHGARRRSSDEVSRSLAQALVASMAVILVTFLTFDAMGYSTTAGVTFLLLGCCGALWRLQRAEYPSLEVV